MQRNDFLKSNVMGIVAVTAILSFLTLKVSGLDVQQRRMTVPLYFQGNPTIPSQVENETLWNTDPNDESCDVVNQKACILLVEHTDLTGLNTLNPAKITLGAVSTGVGYIPTRTGGSSSTPFQPINRH